MKKFIYQMFVLGAPDEKGHQGKTPVGLFTSLPEVRKYISANHDHVWFSFHCERWKTNPTPDGKGTEPTPVVIYGLKDL